MQTIEQAIELHQSLSRLAPHPGACLQYITTGNGWASNQEAISLNLTTRIATSDIPPSDPRYNAFRQGFHCVEINILARWGGCNHDGSKRDGTQITVHVLDRLAGGMATKTWETNGAWRAEILDETEVLPLIRSLLA